MIPYPELIKLVANGCRFQYESYDHLKAYEEVKALGVNVVYQANNFFEAFDSCYGIPDHIKQKHIVWRIGKIRSVSFNPDGKMWKFYIGARRTKVFFINDIGVRAKPMIFKSDDHLDLIGQGLAVQDTI
jgi:hypothetical protein